MPRKSASPDRPNPPSSSENATSHLAERLRKLRADRRWSLETLSAACGVSRSMLSQIERNEVNPTLGVLYSIARAFNMSVGALVEIPGASTNLIVIRADDHAFHYRSDKNCRIRTLSPLHLEKDVEFYEVRLKPKGSLRSAAHFRGTSEFLTVQKGHVQVESAGDIETLGPGDSVNYRADVPHAIVNLAREEAILFLVDIYRQGK